MIMENEILMEIEIDIAMVIEMISTVIAIGMAVIVKEVVMVTEINMPINNSIMMIMDQRIVMKIPKINKEVHFLILIWVLQHKIKMMIDGQDQDPAHLRTKMIHPAIQWEILTI